MSESPEEFGVSDVLSQLKDARFSVPFYEDPLIVKLNGLLAGWRVQDEAGFTSYVDKLVAIDLPRLALVSPRGFRWLNALARVVDRLHEAHRLAANGFPSSSVLMSASAFEIFARDGIVVWALRTQLEIDQEWILDDIVVDLFERGDRYKDLLPQIVDRVWRSDIKSWPHWPEIKKACSLRNKVIHKGAEAEMGQAINGLDAVSSFVAAMIDLNDLTEELIGDPNRPQALLVLLSLVTLLDVVRGNIVSS